MCSSPPNEKMLRERKEDIIDLIKKETNESAQSGRKIVFSKEAKDVLKSYDWPGNVRELKRFLQVISIDGHSLISKEKIKKHFQQTICSSKKKILSKEQIEMIFLLGLPVFLEKIEREVIVESFKNNDNAVRKTILQLKINQSKLYKYIRSSEVGYNEIQLAKKI